jgi:hypothetical protein
MTKIFINTHETFRTIRILTDTLRSLDQHHELLLYKPILLGEVRWWPEARIAFFREFNVGGHLTMPDMENGYIRALQREIERLKK